MNIDQINSSLHTVADEMMDLEFQLSEKRRERDALIVAGRAARLSLRVMADACLVSHQTIANILEREEGAAGVATTTAPPASRVL